MYFRRLIYISLMLLALPFLHAKAQTMTKEQAYVKANESIRAWMDSTRARFTEMNEACKDKDFAEITIGSHTMKYWATVYGEQPKDGYALFISLHGGGGVPTPANDQQWHNQMRLYAPQGAVYFVPRSPEEAWNMWCLPYMDDFYEAVIRMMVCSDFHVNPNKVYLIGYSAGGDGVWRMAPRMADRWAGASMMAGHPGDVSLVNLRNTPFMIWCGGKDDAYTRNKLCTERGVQMDSLRRDCPEGYIHETYILPQYGHWMERADTAAIKWLQQYVRNPYPKDIVWQQEEVLRSNFYWLSVDKSEMERGKQLRVSVKDNVVNILACDYLQPTLWFNDQFVDLDKKVVVKYKGKTIFKGKLKRNAETICESMNLWQDPSFVYSAKVKVKIKK